MFSSVLRRIFEVNLSLTSGIHCALVRLNEELLEKKSSGSGLEN
jgi:hypothetical protein